MAKRGPKPKPPEEVSPEMMVMSIKMTRAFHVWVGELAEAERDTSVKIVERALVEYGKRRKFKEAPKRTIR